MARKAANTGRIAGSAVLWGSDNFWEPAYRSWPAAPSRLEELAVRAQVSDEELRELLRRSIQERLREKGMAWDGLERMLEKREQRH